LGVSRRYHAKTAPRLWKKSYLRRGHALVLEWGNVWHQKVILQWTETLDNMVITSLDEWLTHGIESKVVVKCNAEIGGWLWHRCILDMHRQHECWPKTSYLQHSPLDHQHAIQTTQ